MLFKKKKSPMRSVEEVVARLKFMNEILRDLEAQLETTENKASLRTKIEEVQYTIGSLEWFLRLRDDTGKWIGELIDGSKLNLPSEFYYDETEPETEKTEKRETEENGSS